MHALLMLPRIRNLIVLSTWTGTFGDISEKEQLLSQLKNGAHASCMRIEFLRLGNVVVRIP